MESQISAKQSPIEGDETSILPVSGQHPEFKFVIRVALPGIKIFKNR